MRDQIRNELFCVKFENDRIDRVKSMSRKKISERGEKVKLPSSTTSIFFFSIAQNSKQRHCARDTSPRRIASDIRYSQRATYLSYSLSRTLGGEVHPTTSGAHCTVISKIWDPMADWWECPFSFGRCSKITLILNAKGENFFRLQRG